MIGPKRKVKVVRNRYRRDRDEHPWFVMCDWCAGSELASMLTLIHAGPGLRGWAPTWEVAQQYATTHALRHEQTRCPTCLHVPSEPLAAELDSGVRR